MGTDKELEKAFKWYQKIAKIGIRKFNLAF